MGELKDSEYNMVCNLMEAQEGIYARGNKAEIASHFQGGFLIILLTVGAFTLLILFVSILFFCVNKFGSYVLVFFLPVFFLLLQTAKFFSRNLMNTLTNLVIDPQGMSVLSQSTVRQVSNKLPWSKVVFADIEHFPSRFRVGNEGTTVCLVYDLADYSFLSRLAFRLQFVNLLNFSRQYLKDTVLNSSKLSIGVPLDLFTLVADRHRFIMASGQWVSSISQSDSLKTILIPQDQAGFTQLWLDDMRSSRRKRIEPLEPETVLSQGRYVVVGRLSAGGQAQIYEAIDKDSDEKVVLKEFILPVSAGTDVRNRSFGNVKNEALVLAGLEHPGVIKLRDHFVQDHRAYLVLEFVEGQNLNEIVKEKGPPGPEKVLDFAKKMTEILKYLHSQEPPVVHRDFTPDNLMVTPEGAVKLIDFNVAKLMESDSTRTVVGKHSYMAPEQFKGKPCPQSDLYSLGCTLYFLSTASDPVPLSRSVLTENSDMENISDTGDGNSEKYTILSDLISGLTSPSLKERLESADQVLEFLQENSGDCY